MSQQLPLMLVLTFENQQLLGIKSINKSLLLSLPIVNNVFDITTGVSINVFVKHPKKSEKRIFYHQLIGKRVMKYEFLNENNLLGISRLTPAKKLIPPTDKFTIG